MPDYGYRHLRVVFQHVAPAVTRNTLIYVCDQRCKRHDHFESSATTALVRSVIIVVFGETNGSQKVTPGGKLASTQRGDRVLSKW